MRSGFSKQVAVVTGLAAFGAVGLAGCSHSSTVSGWQANGTPVHECPNEPWWNYQLVYHPNTGVYFEPYSHTWHWQEDGEWRSSKTRPAPVGWRPAEAVVVKMNWDTPEFGHTTVSAMHPQMRTWDRVHPITVPPIVDVDSALTQDDTRPLRDIDEVINITSPTSTRSSALSESEGATEITSVTEPNSPE